LSLNGLDEAFNWFRSLVKNERYHGVPYTTWLLYRCECLDLVVHVPCIRQEYAPPCMTRPANDN